MIKLSINFPSPPRAPITMAQGAFKLKAGKSDAKKSRANKKHIQRQKQLAKGPKAFKAKGRKSALAQQESRTSKAINSKNEVAIAARAVGAGSRFSLKDIEGAGKKELGKQRTETRRRESKRAMGERLKEQLHKLT